jgi:hypothetical protein
MPTASDEKGEHLAAFLNEKFPEANAQYEGPDRPSAPTKWFFDLPGLGKRLAIDERVYEAWPAHKSLLEKVFEHYGLLEQLRTAGPGEYRLLREGEKVKMTL